MKLKEFNEKVTKASQNAHLFFAGGYGGPERIKSVSLRIDDDGVLSIILHPQRMPDRVPTEESKKIGQALKVMKDLLEREPELKGSFDEFDGFFVHWDEITDALANAGEDYLDYLQSPMELIGRLIEERDQLKEQIEAPTEGERDGT